MCSSIRFATRTYQLTRIQPGFFTSTTRIAQAVTYSNRATQEPMRPTTSAPGTTLILELQGQEFLRPTLRQSVKQMLSHGLRAMTRFAHLTVLQVPHLPIMVFAPLKDLEMQAPEQTCITSTTALVSQRFRLPLLRLQDPRLRLSCLSASSGSASSLASSVFSTELN